MREQIENPDRLVQDAGDARTPEVRDCRSKPEGVVPRQSQAYVIAGLAILILLAVMFSNNRAKSAAKPPAALPVVYSSDANQRNIEQLKRDLTEQQQRSEQQQARVLGSQGDIHSGIKSVAPNDPANSSEVPRNVAVSTEPPRDPVADAERALSFKARFASNLVNSGDSSARAAAFSEKVAPQQEPSSSRSVVQPFRASDSGTKASDSKKPAEVNVNAAHGQPYVIFEGTMIDAALVNRLDGEYSGPVKVMVTNPVYSQDRQHVLIPEGTFILGEAQKVSGLGQRRLAVIFHRLIMPDGFSVDLDQFHGLDQAGETGFKDKIDNHYFQIFGASIALGVIAGATEATTSSGFAAAGSDAYRQGVASSLSQSGARALDRFINIPPTLTIHEGHRIKVYLRQDLLLPAYENHTVPADI